MNGNRMAERYLLDTHVWVWMQEGNTKISKPSIELIDTARRENNAFVSVLSIWEIAWLEQARRIELSLPIQDWLHAAFTLGRLKLLPLAPEIAIESTRLPGTLHRDPADRILAATARIERLTLLTRDQRLLDYGRKGHLRVRKT